MTCILQSECGVVQLNRELSKDSCSIILRLKEATMHPNLWTFSSRCSGGKGWEGLPGKCFATLTTTTGRPAMSSLSWRYPLPVEIEWKTSSSLSASGWTCCRQAVAFLSFSTVSSTSSALSLRNHFSISSSGCPPGNPAVLCLSCSKAYMWMRKSSTLLVGVKAYVSTLS